MIRKETKTVIIYYYYINYILFILINTTYIVPFKSLKCTSFQTSCHVHVGTGVVNEKIAATAPPLRIFQGKLPVS